MNISSQNTSRSSGRILHESYTCTSGIILKSRFWAHVITDAHQLIRLEIKVLMPSINNIKEYKRADKIDKINFFL